MMNSVQMFVRLYVLEGRDFASRDIGGSSDTYIVVTCGDKVISERENYQIDESNPQFNKCYEFSATFPGAYPIEIEGYDYDDLFGDDLIGKTSIDLDDRQFCPEWKALQYKPIEEREIYHPSTCLAQGAIRCWLDIFD
jgi:Ca2+-dependent lipid-binding protein